jgi:TusA-related sulfurtransferase
MPVYEIAMLIDARGLVGQTPTARTAQAMRSVRSGDVVEVVASDAGAFQEFAAWARSTGNELLDSSAFGGTYRFVIRHR